MATQSRGHSTQSRTIADRIDVLTGIGLPDIHELRGSDDYQHAVFPESRMAIVKIPNAEPIRGYRLIEPIGSGGFGEVWKCEAPGGIFKAVKFVYGNINGLSSVSKQAENELRAVQHVKSIRHPFLLSIDRVECIEGELVIVMELADRS